MKADLKILLLDNYDSFTYNLYDYLEQLGANCLVLRNDELKLSDLPELQVDGVVLSPGPKRPADAGLLMPVLDYFQDKLPVLGVCLGMQAIGEYFGAELVHARLPKHGKVSSVFHDKSILFDKVPSPTTVMRYHSLVLQNLPECLVATAWTQENELMALQHKKMPIFGWQFHPESILTVKGMQMLKNWTGIVQHCKNNIRLIE